MEQQVVAPYCAGENFSYRLKDDSIIHSFRSEQEDSEWKDGEGWLTTLVQMRSELMHGDHRAAEKARRDREQAEKRKKHLGSLAGRESSLWAKVDELIATKLPKRYDEAVSLLQDLHDLAVMSGESADFSFRMRALHDEHARKPSLLEKFRKAKLLG